MEARRKADYPSLQYEPYNAPEDAGSRDAFRHALWSYTLTKSLGPAKARYITDAHERIEGNKPGSRLMDLHNNWVARRLAMDPKNRDRDPEDVVREALDAGLLRTRDFAVMDPF